MGYYTELARGQIDLLSARESISSIVADPDRDPELQRRLRRVLDARRFAIDEMGLPDNASYTTYADLGRDHVLWNVLATPEFSLDPVTDCFPIAGCVSYRGHYRQAEALKQAEHFRHQGHDVIVSGVPAFSTLGWFSDPVLNTMMHWRDSDLLGTVFHELAHQKIYVKDDSAFNESFASFVEHQGLHEYLGTPVAGRAEAEQRRRQFVNLIMDTRQRLQAAYEQPGEEAQMRRRKSEIFHELRDAYRVLRHEQWDGLDAYGGWFAQPLNNASLLPFGLYVQWVPAFEHLFEQSQRDWHRFYDSVDVLAKLDAEKRRERMKELMP